MPTDAPATAGIPLRVATWNIHSGVGRDGRYDPCRIIAVLHELAADVIALQEVASLADHGEFLPQLRAELGFEIVTGPTRVRAGDDYGNALLSRYPVSRMSRLDLSVHVHEPRGAIDATLVVGARNVRVLSTHLGLRPYERDQQVRRVLATIDPDDPQPVVLMGDLNEWFLWGRALRCLHADFHARPAPPTFPARWPIFALDRIWIRPSQHLRSIATHVTVKSRIASDHLPLVADIELPATH
ncbi:MAG: endonuclease/exonuclease/phosphatase family protein [Betaproteobacteria bacterium]